MTSWIRTLPPMKKRVAAADAVAEEETPATPAAKPLFLVASNEDAPTQFLNYFYATLYARAEGLPLVVYDSNTSVAPGAGLFRNTFYDQSGVTFVDSMMNSVIPIQRRAAQMTAFLQKLKRDAIAEEAQLFFELNDAAGARVRDYLKGVGPAALPHEYDVAVVFQPADAVSVGDRRGVSVVQYLSALRSFQARAGLQALRIFLASSDANFTFELKRQADKSWSFYSFPPSRVATATGSTPTLRMRQEAFTQSLAELVVLQHAPAVVGRFGSALGRILYLTREEPASFLALDGGVFRAV